MRHLSRGSKRFGAALQPERVDGSRRDESLRPRSCSQHRSVAVWSALLTRLPASTRER
jgi:hypothetical protein